MSSTRDSSFDELVERLFKLSDAPSVERERIDEAVAKACEMLDRVHAIYLAAGQVESASELLAIVDARTRLAAAAGGDRVSLRCDVLLDAATAQYDQTLAELAPVLERTLHATLGDSWPPPSFAAAEVEEEERPTLPF